MYEQGLGACTCCVHAYVQDRDKGHMYMLCIDRDRRGTHLLRQLMEEEFGEVCNAWLSVFQAEGDGTDVSLHLHHVVEDEVAEDGQRVLPHQNRLINQSAPKEWTSAYESIVQSMYVYKLKMNLLQLIPIKSVLCTTL